MSVLTISDTDILKTARLSTADAVAVADAAFVSGSELAAIEAEIQPAALSDLSLRPLLLRNVIKLLAAELLDMRSRAAGATGTYQGGGITIGQEWDHPARLRSEARLALAPYRMETGAKEPTFVAPVDAISSLAEQSLLFGPTEAERLRGEDKD